MARPYIICHMIQSIDGRPQESEPIRLNLTHVQPLDDIIWARYTI